MFFQFFASLLVATSAFDYEALHEFNFQIDEGSVNDTTAVLPAEYSQHCDDMDEVDVNLQILQDDIFHDLAIVRSSCYAFDRANRFYKVEKGMLSSGKENFIAYKIHPHQKEFVNKLRGSTQIYFNNKEANVEYAVYSYVNKTFTQEATFEPSTNTEYDFVNTTVQIEKNTEPVIYVFVPKTTRISHWSKLSDGVDGMEILHQAGFVLRAAKYQLEPNLLPFDATKNSTNRYRYGYQKMFHKAWLSGQTEPKIVWQDVLSGRMYMSHATDSMTTIELPNMVDTLPQGTVFKDQYKLYCFAANKVLNQVVYLMARNGDTGLPDLQLFKVDSETGDKIQQKKVSAAKNVTNVAALWGSGGDMQWNHESDEISMLLTRKDDSGHQGSESFIFDSDTLEIKKTWWFGGHVFGHLMSIAKDGKFLEVQLGDNNPRGVVIRHYNSTDREERLVYTFKTQHNCCDEEKFGDYGVYEEISTSEKTYYKKSNDNNVYSELAFNGPIELDDAYLIFFIGENNPLDMRSVGAQINDPRNVACVKIPKDLKSEEVLSQGQNSSGQFYTFYGSLRLQNNVGIRWLTNYKDLDESATRLKTIRLAPNKNLAIFEIQTVDNVWKRSVFLIVDDDGILLDTINLQPPSSDSQLRLPPTDDLFFDDNGNIVMYSGLAPSVGNIGGQLLRYELCYGDTCNSVLEDAGNNAVGEDSSDDPNDNNCDVNPNCGSTQPNSSDNGSGTDIGAIVGGVLGGLVACALIASLVTFIVLRQKKKPTNTSESTANLS